MDEDDADTFALSSPGAAALPEVSRSIRYGTPSGDTQQQARELAREFDDDAMEPPPGPGLLEVLPECCGTPPGDVSAVLQAAIALGQQSPGSTLPPAIPG